MDPVRCNSCGTRVPVEALTVDDRRALTDQHYCQVFEEELRMLVRVEDYYRRHPGVEGTIKPHFASLLESDDPEVVSRLCSGVPFDQILLPTVLPEPPVDGPEDAEIVDYLQHHHFELRPRMESAAESIAEFHGAVGTVPCVPCPRCRNGSLDVPTDEWDAFATATNDIITWYWPDWHNFDDEGTLNVKTSGWEGGCHWTGSTPISMDKPDYAFWCWFVAQKEYHRLVEETELPAIREHWRVSAPPS